MEEFSLPISNNEKPSELTVMQPLYPTCRTICDYYNRPVLIPQPVLIFPSLIDQLDLQDRWPNVYDNRNSSQNLGFSQFFFLNTCKL